MKVYYSLDHMQAVRLLLANFLWAARIRHSHFLYLAYGNIRSLFAFSTRETM